MHDYYYYFGDAAVTWDVMAILQLYTNLAPCTRRVMMAVMEMMGFLGALDFRVTQDLQGPLAHQEILDSRFVDWAALSRLLTMVMYGLCVLVGTNGSFWSYWTKRAERREGEQCRVLHSGVSDGCLQ